VAAAWRDRRLFLAGDAAHQTPPFLGQGMCAGLRDAANLAWKLAAVLDGSADDRLLDSYQLEREPHARAVIDAAVAVGQLICMLDPDEARARDEALLADYRGESTAPDFIPPLGPGPCVGPGGGGLSPQPQVGGVRLDDRAGTGFLLCTDVPVDPSGAAAVWWEGHGVVLDARSTPEVADLLDGHEACVVRPDRYVLARGSLDEVTACARAALGQPVRA